MGGVLKLGAAALLLASTLNEEEEAGYGYKRRRHQRAAEGISSSPDALFALVRSMDMYECGKSLVCELEAKKEGELLEDEALIMSLFSDRKTKKIVNPGSAKAEYDLAAELGLATKDQVICRQRYASCPYTGDEMMKALRQAHLTYPTLERSYPISLHTYTQKTLYPTLLSYLFIVPSSSLAVSLIKLAKKHEGQRFKKEPKIKSCCAISVLS